MVLTFFSGFLLQIIADFQPCWILDLESISASRHWLRMCFSSEFFSPACKWLTCKSRWSRWCIFFDSFVVVCGQLSDLCLLILKRKARWFLKLLLRWLCHVHMFQVDWNYQRFAKVRHSIASPCDCLLEILYSFSSTGTQVFTQNVQDSGMWRLTEKNTWHPKKLQKCEAFFVNVGDLLFSKWLLRL